MSKSVEILKIEKAHFTVRVYESMLKIDLKGGVKDEIEDALENKPVLRETIGNILAIFVPLHVHLSDIDSVLMDGKGKVTVKLPRHRDVNILLGPDEAKRLLEKLNKLIPKEKERELRRIMQDQKLRRVEQAEREFEREEAMPPIGGTQFPMPPPSGVREKEKEAAEEQEK
jgi:hypothetical protein